VSHLRRKSEGGELLEIYKAKQAINKIPNKMGDIHPAKVPQMATPANNIVKARNTLLERSGFTKRSTTSTTAGLRKRIAGFQAIDEFGNLIGKDARKIIVKAIITKDV
jgi:hypothetical protein